MSDWSADPVEIAVDLAFIADEVAQLDALLGDVFQRPTTSSKEVMFPNTRAEFGDDFTDAVVFFLENHGLADSDVDPPKRINRESLIDLLMRARTVAQTFDVAKEEFETGDFELVCTLPDSDPGFEDRTPAAYDMRQISSALLDVCRTADDSLLVVSPFLESQGIEWLQPGIEGAIRRGVDVTIVSRELREGEPNMRALAELVEIEGGQHGRLRVYDYYEPDPNSEKPLYTLHSKVIVADEREAYIGSANFTNYGLSQNLEVGVILRGEEVADLQAVFAAVIDRAREVIGS
jgi:phosphatidylserine/phosphatidylglycerophosphate/cardiolipin synthase-like enzyme